MNKTVLIEYLKKNGLALGALVLGLVSLIVAFGFNAKILEGKFRTDISDEVRKGLNREMQNVSQDARAAAKQEVGQLETRLGEVEKSLADIKLLVADTDNKSNDVNNRLATLESRINAIDQQLVMVKSSSRSAPKLATASTTSKTKKVQPKSSKPGHVLKKKK